MTRHSLVITGVAALVIVTTLWLCHWWRWRDCTSVEEARAHVGDIVSTCFFVNAATSTLAGSFLYSEPFGAAGTEPMEGLTVFIPP